jgi:serine/threonine-protein kinase
MSLAAGLRLSNRFTLLELIGAGGMSQVWRAEDEVLGRLVAVKVLSSALAADPALRTAVQAEARAAARLTHPHVTRVYDYGESVLPGGERVPYLVLELVEGQSLADRLRFGPLPWPQAVTTAAEVASALAAAHRIGVVHHDVKPGNVMLTRAGAKVLDFGIAALVGGPPAAGGGRLAGTPAYAAPERLRPVPATPASDVYGLGVLLYQALTGRLPRAVASWQQFATAHQPGVPVAPPEVAGLPGQVRRLCLACLSPDPAARPTAEQVERGLATAAAAQPATGTATMPMVFGTPPGGHGTRAGPGPGFPPPPYPPTMIDPGAPAGQPGAPPARRPLRWLVVLAAAVVALAATVLLVWVGQQSGGNPPAAQPQTTATASAPPSPTPSVTSSTPSPTADNPQAIVAQLDETVTAALAAGRIDTDAADRLHDKIDDLRTNLGKRNKVGREARELQQRIDEMRTDAEIDQQTADQLTSLLQALTGRN